MKRTGFTLTELLIVLSILALLAAILLPVFALVRRKGQRTNCISNLHQLHIACALYAQDADGFLPPYLSEPNDSPSTRGGCLGERSDLLLAALNPYLHSKDVWHCPSDFSKPPSGETMCGLPLLNLTSYYYGGFRVTSHGTALMRIDGTSNLRHNIGEPAVWRLLSDNFSCPGDGRYSLYNHGGRWNTVFLDGHAGSFGVDCSSPPSEVLMP